MRQNEQAGTSSQGIFGAHANKADATIEEAPKPKKVRVDVISYKPRPGNPYDQTC